MFIIIGGDGKEYGPVTVDQIRTWITAGRANLDTRAKAVGSEDWRPLGDYPEFSGAPVPPVMPLPGGSVMVADGAPSAGRGARTGAALINAFFYMLCTIPGSMLMSRKLLEQHPELAQGGFPRIEDLDLTTVASGLLWVWAGLIAGIVLQGILLAARGQNLGKMLVGIRVVRADNGHPATVGQAVLLRFLLPVAVIMVLNFLTAVLGLVFLLVDYCFMFRQDGRCLHDLIAGTRVVKA